MCAKEIGSFLAKTDDGKEYRIIQYQKYVDMPTHDHPDDLIPGTKFMLTSDGLRVNFIDSETFMIVATGEIVKKIS